MVIAAWFELVNNLIYHICFDAMGRNFVVSRFVASMQQESLVLQPNNGTIQASYQLKTILTYLLH